MARRRACLEDVGVGEDRAVAVGVLGAGRAVLVVLDGVLIQQLRGGERSGETRGDNQRTGATPRA